jgi:hypothetical protein
MSHTLGPWKIGESNAYPYIYASRAIESQQVGCHVATLARTRDCDANARLIAAAPDLLAACEFAARIFGGHSGASDDPKTRIEVEQGFCAIDNLRAAIAKAEQSKQPTA